MIFAEHCRLLHARELAPRVVQREIECQSGKPVGDAAASARAKDTVYYGWTPVWEGPPRPDFLAARADLLDFMRSAEYKQRMEG
jgi:hypothetical protein